MSRLSSMGRTPISERIKVFDASSSPKKTPAVSPRRPREASITPTVDLRPVTKAAREPGAAKAPVAGAESLRRVDRPGTASTTPRSANRSDSGGSSKQKVARTDSLRGAPSMGPGAGARKPVTGVSSPRAVKKPVVEKGPSGIAKNPKGSPGASPGGRTGWRGPAPRPPGQPPASPLPRAMANKNYTPKTSLTHLDVKPDVIADIQPAAAEDASVPADEVAIAPAEEAEPAELTTKKLISDMRQDEDINQPVVIGVMASQNCDAVEVEEGGEEMAARKNSVREVKNMLARKESAKEFDEELAGKESVEEMLARKESVEEMLARKESVEEVDCEAALRRQSVKQADSAEMAQKKSIIELEAEEALLRKKSVKDVEESYFRKQSLVKTDKAGYFRKESLKHDLEELAGGNQYFTKQALNNATSTTINQAMKLDVEYKQDKITSLGREVTELETRGANDEEVARLKKQKADLEGRLREQEEELDDLASQVQNLEGGKLKLEADVNQLKKEHRREVQCKEDELEDARAAAAKKVKILEQQLEQEHEERINFLRERHELEGKIMGLQDMLERSGDEEQVAKLKKDLKRTKALLKDAQLMLEKSQNEGTNKVIMRQLKNQLEDAEFARTAAAKSKQNAELELADVQVQLEDVSRSKAELDEKNIRMGREKADLATHLQETEEELQDVMRKYKASVSAVTTDQITIQDQAATIQTLEAERNKLREQCAEISQRLDHMEGENVSTAQHKRLELKIRELESKLELEKTTKGRLDTQIVRSKEGSEKMIKEIEDLRLKESNCQEDMKKLSRVVRELKEELATVRGKESETNHKKGDLEKQLEVSEAETAAVRGELKTALKRVEDLQAAISGEIDTDNSDADSDSSDEEMSVFLDHHRRAMSVQRERESQMREMRSSQTRELRSMSREPVRDIRSMSRDIRASVARDFESATRDLALRPAEEATTAISFNAIVEEE